MKRLLSAMEALSRRQKGAVLMLGDAAVAPLALLLALLTTPPPGLVVPGGTLMEGAALVPWLMIVAGGLSHATGIARIPLADFESDGLARTALLAACLALALGALAGAAGLRFTPGLCVVFGAFYLLSAFAARTGMRGAITMMRRAIGTNRRVVIYGAGATGRQLAAALRAHETIEVVAFVDDNPGLHGLRIAGLPVLAPASLAQVAAARGVRRVLLALPSLSRPDQLRILRKLERGGLEVLALPSFAQLVGEEPLVERLAPVKAGRLLGREAHDKAMRGGCQGYRGRSVLISGAGGSIGAELSRQILACEPRRLVLYELSELALYTIEQELAPLAAETGSEIVPVLGSVCDALQVRDALARHAVEVVLHAAAYKHVPLVESNPLAGLANNVLGTLTLARAAQMAGVGRFVLVSSDKAVRPTGVMGASKRLAELVVRDLAAQGSRTCFATVRFGNVLGSSGSVVPLFQEQVTRGGPVTLTHEEVTRYFMTIEEAVRLVLLAGSIAEGGEIFVLQMGEPMRIRDLARAVIEAQGYTVRDAENPEGDIAIVTTGLRPGEKLHEELTISGRQRATRHPKIFAAVEGGLSRAETGSMLRALRAAVEAGDGGAAIAIASRFVEGEMAAARASQTLAPVAPAPAAAIGAALAGSAPAPVVALAPTGRREGRGPGAPGAPSAGRPPRGGASPAGGHGAADARAARA